MSEVGKVQALLQALVGRVTLYDPPPPEEVEQLIAQLPHPLPEALRELYTLSNGMFLGPADELQVFSLEDLEALNGPAAGLVELPSALFFAEGKQGHLFWIDTDAHLGFGSEAVLACHRSAITERESVFCAPTLTAFFTLAATTPAFEKERPQVEALRLDAMREALQATPDAWEGQAGASDSDIAEAERRCGLRFPQVVRELLRFSNGLFLKQPRLALAPTTQITPLHTFLQDQWPDTLLLGTDEAGHRYLVTTGHWNETYVWLAQRGQVVRLPSDEADPEPEVLGYLPEVIIGWLR